MRRSPDGRFTADSDPDGKSLWTKTDDEKSPTLPTEDEVAAELAAASALKKEQEKVAEQQAILRIIRVQ